MRVATRGPEAIPFGCCLERTVLCTGAFQGECVDNKDAASQPACPAHRVRGECVNAMRLNHVSELLAPCEHTLCGAVLRCFRWESAAGDHDGHLAEQFQP